MQNKLSFLSFVLKIVLIWNTIFRNLDIRDAILQLLNVIREGNKKLIQHDKSEGEISNQVLMLKNFLQP